MFRFRKCSILSLALILFLLTPLSAQDIWRDTLKELFSRMSSGQTDLNKGKVAEVNLVEDQPEMLTLHVKLSDSGGASRGVLTALVMNQQRKFAHAFVPPLKMVSSGGDYKIFIKRKNRDAEITSDTISVLLVDLGSLSIVDSKTIPLQKQWGVADSSVVDTGEPESNPALEELAGEPEIPGDIEITPEPVGDTPTASSEREEADTSNKPETTDNKPTLTINPNMRATLKPMQLAYVPLTSLASKASWTNGVKGLHFGADGKESGTVKVMPKAYLNNGKLYKNVLFTHCRWADRGYVSGTFHDIRIPEKAKEFTAEIGFIRGATKAGAFDFVVRFFPLEKGLKPVVIGKKRITYRSGVQTFSGKIPQNLRGIKGNLAISVQAVNSSAQGWTAWYNPVIR
jgi:hypothetical protein